jgi:hypothetical protein
MCEQFHYVLFTNQAVGLSQLAINMQNNPVPSPGMVKETCADFEHVDVLNNKMANGLSKLSKGGPKQGFDHHDLQLVLPRSMTDVFGNLE